MPKLKSKEKRELIDHLVGNCECDGESLFEEDDRSTLEKMELEQLLKLSGNEGDEDDDDDGGGEEESAEEEQEASAEEGKAEEQTVTNKIKEDDLPEEWREDLKFARNQRRQKKDQLIAKITTNEDGMFTKKELESMDLDQLTKLASYVKTPEKKTKTPRLGGHHETVVNESEPLGEPIPNPVINWNE